MKTGWLASRALLGGIASLAFGISAAAQAPDASPRNVPTDKPFFAEPVADTALKAITGREDTVQQSTANQTADVTANSVGDNVRTGNATIAGNAFQNLSGLSVLSVNTGNNVAINAAMNVNISINPAP